MSSNLFDEFSEVSAKQWKQKIQVDLKGADYNDTLIWQSNEGISVKPFYHSDEFEALNIPEFSDNSKICQSIFISDEQTAVFLAKDALQRGANAIHFEASEPFDIDKLIDSIVIPAKAIIYFKLNFLSLEFTSDLIEKTKPYQVFLNIDLIGNLAKSGNWFTQNKDTDFDILKSLFSKTHENTTILGVDASLYQNAGANIVQQIAYTLAHVNEYLNFFENSNVTSSTSTSLSTGSVEKSQFTQFNFAVGSNYFFEIAKLRAFRYLFKLLCQEYNYNIEPHIFVTPSLRNKTLYDYNTNMLRTTTECMSALLGGANVVANIAYDAVYHKKNEFGERIARNQLLILQEESYFKEASAFAEGSYYIESLTKQLAERSLALFKDIENNGGFLKQLFEGTIQRKITESAEKEQIQFDNGALILLGTNKHPNSNDKMKDDLELYPFVKIKPRKTLIQPIIAKRLADKLEQERLKKE